MATSRQHHPGPDDRLFFFEFMDQVWLPNSLRLTMVEMLEAVMSRPFRTYYDWLSGEVLRCAAQLGSTHIVELAAGAAPLTRRMAGSPGAVGKQLIICDENPDPAVYSWLEQKHPGQVIARYDRVHLGDEHSWPERSLLVLSAAFHHIPPRDRDAVLETLAQSADLLIIAEPLRRHILSFILVTLTFVPGLLFPILRMGSPGTARRLFWSWLIPMAPLMLTWDGLVSCWRQWTRQDWQAAFRRLEGRCFQDGYSHSLLCQVIRCRSGPPAGECDTPTAAAEGETLAR